LIVHIIKFHYYLKMYKDAMFNEINIFVNFHFTFKNKRAIEYD